MAEGQLWELKCAYDEGIPVLLIYGTTDGPTVPDPIKGKAIKTWTWDNIKAFLDSL